MVGAKNNNLNMHTNTNLDDNENKNILPKDSNKTETVITNDQNINSIHNDTDIQRSIQKSNTKLINEYEMVHDSELG